MATASHLAHGGERADTMVSTQFGLSRPLVALGASAHCHYPAIARAIGAELIVPEDADVAGAVGAAAGLDPATGHRHSDTTHRWCFPGARVCNT